jgi:lipoate-protein ligase A
VLVLDGETAREQMAIDEALARGGQPTLRLFRWRRPALSLGRNQIRPDWLDEGRMSAAGVEVVERPTGGGLALHGSDLSCSVVVPHAPGLRLSFLMARVCRALAHAFSAFGPRIEWHGDVPASSRVVYCLAQPSSYALYAQGKKFGGFAIRRYPTSVLVQGSCAIRECPASIRELLSPTAADAYARASTWLEAACGCALDEHELVEQVIRAWHDAWIDALT